MDGGNWEYWLNMTNLALGVTTLAAVLVVLGAIGYELLSRTARRARAAAGMDAEFNAMINGGTDARLVQGLGLTMADGGEKIDSSAPSDSDQTPRRK